MNSEKFIFQNSLEANYLSIRLEPEDRLDEIAVNVIGKDCPDFLIPFRMVSVNEEISLKYKLINTVALEYAEMTLPKALFVQLYLNLLEPFVKGRDWFWTITISVWIPDMCMWISIPGRSIISMCLSGLLPAQIRKYWIFSELFLPR